jgi:hypothetical protein
LTDVTSETLRLQRESKGGDVPPWMARQLRKAARCTGEDLAAVMRSRLPLPSGEWKISKRCVCLAITASRDPPQPKPAVDQTRTTGSRTTE